MELAVRHVVLLDHQPSVVGVRAHGHQGLIEGEVAAVENNVARGCVNVERDVAGAGEEEGVQVHSQLQVVVRRYQGARKPQPGERVVRKQRRVRLDRLGEATVRHGRMVLDGVFLLVLLLRQAQLTRDVGGEQKEGGEHEEGEDEEQGQLGPGDEDPGALSLLRPAQDHHRVFGDGRCAVVDDVVRLG